MLKLHYALTVYFFFFYNKLLAPKQYAIETDVYIVLYDDATGEIGRDNNIISIKLRRRREKINFHQDERNNDNALHSFDETSEKILRIRKLV